jgi:hypothetical protein
LKVQVKKKKESLKSCGNASKIKRNAWNFKGNEAKKKEMFKILKYALQKKKKSIKFLRRVYEFIDVVKISQLPLGIRRHAWNFPDVTVKDSTVFKISRTSLRNR